MERLTLRTFSVIDCRMLSKKSVKVKGIPEYLSIAWELKFGSVQAIWILVKDDFSRQWATSAWRLISFCYFEIGAFL